MRGGALGAMLLIGAVSLVIPVAAGAVEPADNSSSSGSSLVPGATTTSPPATSRTTTALRSAAVSWAKAFLTGSPDDIRRLQGPECRSTSTASTLSPAEVALYLRGLRASMRAALGKPLDRIRIEDVELRNVTGNRGEAQVVYDLPQEKVGNDNWVEFTMHGGRWKVSNRNAPILGRSTSSRGSTATADPSAPR